MRLVNVDGGRPFRCCLFTALISELRSLKFHKNGLEGAHFYVFQDGESQFDIIWVAEQGLILRITLNRIDLDLMGQRLDGVHYGWGQSLKLTLA